MRPLNPSKPRVTAICPPGVPDECRFRYAIYARLGALPKATPAARRNAALLGVGTKVLQPGTTGTLSIRFTKAGKKAIKRGRAVKVRVRVDVASGIQRGTFVKAASIRARKRKS